MTSVRILGIDPGLNRTGWGVIDYTDNRLSFVAGGCIHPDARAPMAMRLGEIDRGLAAVIAEWTPDEAAIEETFSNTNAASTLKLGMARGVAFVAPARAGLVVGEYAANTVKKAVVGAGHAGKEQVQAMVKILLPKASFEIADTADALAVAICHAHHRTSNNLT
ncbi:MAG: crossover junction endodeoxyribonuclease RuvC [Rhodospirillales bacterium]|nr:crossover junction endodeoxyribonuclease RuvC [Alphaproteobacteria bacterium]MCB9987400.1 crossover junction endodeoxyribonuclease RuvC [Rhodospirillales bacterium]USO07618.1 MAG: crossover junction endodeoxyribonuclease RuvC [Rhodospirillales bacterium]